MPALTSAAAWLVEPPLVVVIVFAGLYRLGGQRRVGTSGARRERWRAAAFYGGLAVVVIALDSPLDGLAGRLFAAHMAQHVLLLSVAPVLIVVSAPWMRIWQPLPLELRRAVARTVVRDPRARGLRVAAHALGQPLNAWLLFNVNLLLWHVPALYSATLRSQLVHDTEHLLFFSTALLFWAQAFDSPPFRARLDLVRRAAFVAAGLAVAQVLSMVLAFAPHPLYDVYSELGSRPGGLSAMGDQQIAAGLMWVPGSIPYLVAIVLCFYRWLDPRPDDPLARRRALRVEVAGGPVTRD